MIKRAIFLILVCLVSAISQACQPCDGNCIQLAAWPCFRGTRALVYYEKCSGGTGYKEVVVTEGGHLFIGDDCKRIYDVICNSDWA